MKKEPSIELTPNKPSERNEAPQIFVVMAELAIAKSKVISNIVVNLEHLRHGNTS
jgi:hypothetical protein